MPRGDPGERRVVWDLAASTGRRGVLWLADVAQHIDSLDGMLIGAATLLETSGDARCNEQLPLWESPLPSPPLL